MLFEENDAIVEYPYKFRFTYDREVSKKYVLMQILDYSCKPIMEHSISVNAFSDFRKLVDTVDEDIWEEIQKANEGMNAKEEERD